MSGYHDWHNAHTWYRMTATQLVQHALNLACTSVPHVPSTTCTMCAQHHMYTTPLAQCVHNAIITLHHSTMCTLHAWDVCDTTCTQCHMHKMYTTPLAHSTTCTTCTQHHMHTTPLVQSCTPHHMYNMHTKPLILIQVDIGDHPPSPLGPPPVFLSSF